MAPGLQVTRGSGATYVEFFGRDDKAAKELSKLVKSFLEGSMYRVEYLTSFEGTTLKVYDDE